MLALFQDTFDIMDSVYNYLSLCYACRPWSYEAISLLRALHESRFFWNVAVDAKQQKLLLLDTVEGVWADNTTRAEGSR